MSADPLTPEAFAAQCGVSRETLDRLKRYATLLERWQRTINLVGRATLADVWRRHFWDSAQLLPHLPSSRSHVLDVGSGAGFPGLVLAILGVAPVTLVESDIRKCAFLREVARQTGTTVTLHAARLEDLTDRISPPDVITARAVAPLPLLLDRVKLYITPTTVCLFHKGAQMEAELAAARQVYSLRVQKIPSATHRSGVILRVEDIARERDHGEDGIG